MTAKIEPSAIQRNEQDRIKLGTITFLEKYRGLRVEQYTSKFGNPRYYNIEGYQGDFPSVTSITGIVNKPRLPDWYKRKGIEKAISLMAEPTMINECQSVANEKNDRAKKHNAKQPKVRWNDQHTWQTIFYDKAKSGPQDAMDIATGFGNDSHDLIQSLACEDMGRPEPNVARGMVSVAQTPIAEGFEAWLRDSDIEIVASELMVFHPAYRYAGTIDLVGVRKRDPLGMVVIDLKTGGVFDEAAMQISAYAEALDYLTMPGWHADEALVLQLPRERPDEWDADKLYEVHKVNSIPACHDAFISAMNLQQRLNEETWIK